MSRVATEWLAWVDVYNDLFSITDRSNGASGQPLGTEIDNAQALFFLALSATIDGQNVECLANKANVGSVVATVSRLGAFWGGQFDVPPPLPFTPTYCVSIVIKAAPVPVLTPGTPASLPLDIRLRFTDGNELPGIPLAVTITATSATVSPAGGILPTPIVTAVSVTATSGVSTITIGAVVVPGSNPGLEDLPGGILTIDARGDIGFDGGGLYALVRLDDTLGAGLRVTDQRGTFAPQESIAVTLPATVVGIAGDGYTARGAAALTRTITGAPGGLVVSFAATTQASIAVDGAPVRNADVVAGIGDAYSVFLRVPFDVTPTVNDGDLFVTPTGGSRVRLTQGVPIRLPAGRNVVTFDAGIRRRYQGLVAGQPLTGQTSGTHSYSLAFRAAP